MLGRLVGIGRSCWASGVRLALPLLFVPVVSGCGDDHVIQWRERVTDAEGEHTVGAACAILGEGDQVGSGSPGSGGEGDAASRPGYQLQWEGVADGVRLSVFDVHGELVEEREFGEAFLDGGEREEITPALDGGGLLLTVWGGERCDEIDASEFE